MKLLNEKMTGKILWEPMLDMPSSGESKIDKIKKMIALISKGKEDNDEDYADDNKLDKHRSDYNVSTEIRFPERYADRTKNKPPKRYGHYESYAIPILEEDKIEQIMLVSYLM